MLNVARSSIYEEITLEREGSPAIALEGRTLEFSYYESLLSPYITANLVYIDTGNGMKSNESDTQERYGTLLRSLPIEGRGDETIKFKITNEIGSLNFSTYPLKVLEPLPISQESNREVVILRMISEYGFKNENVTIYEKYYNNITNSVSSILTEKLGIPQNKLFLDQTQNSCAFTGAARRPFDLVIDFAAQSIPQQGAPGFLFWETQNGFNFKAIDNLVTQTPVATYKYYNVLPTSFNDEDKNYRILSSPTYIQNQNVLRALRAGVYRTKNIAFNPYTFKYEEIYLGLDESGIKTLGQEPKFNSEFNDNNIATFTKINHFILDTGNNEPGISTAMNNNPLLYKAKADMRYNLLITQIMDITVPANPTLKAGDIINCEFEKITSSNKNEGSVDEHQSGKYMILNLCHHFTPTKSFTSLRLVRDTYGLYTSGGL